jgi:hypothetical protein
MITTRIKALFQFIDFLHSNIDNFKKYNEVLNELHLLDEERQKVQKSKNFKEKLKFDEIQKAIKEKFTIIQVNISEPIELKAIELNVCNPNNTDSFWNYNVSEIIDLHNNFSKDDLPQIFSYKNKYIDYRTNTHSNFFSLQFFFNDLDKILKLLFDFFKETDENEFEAFEQKTIEVNSLIEAVQVLKNGAIDPRYYLTTFVNEEEQETQNYKYLKQSINENGFFGVNSENRLFKIYTPELALIFSRTNFKVENMETQKETLINTFDYLKTYIEAYKEGEQYFEKEFKLSVNGMYSENAKLYVKDIHDNYFHVQHVPSQEGWSYVKKCYPFILTHEAIKKFGYYSGIVSKVEEQVKKYYQIFDTFDVCEHNEETDLVPLIENKTKKFIVQFFENMDKQGWNYAFKSEEDYSLFIDLLTKFFEYNPFTLPETVIILKRSCKTKVAKVLGEIHKELSENKLVSDTNYFSLIKVLNHFEKENDIDLYKALTR